VDDWALLAQRLVEALCTFNPIVAWVARRLDAERELACDEWVVGVTRTPCVYAKSLLRLAELHLAPARATLAPGALQQSHLARRVESLLRFGSRGRRRAAAWIATAVVAGTFAGSAWLAPTVRVSEAAEAAPEAASTPKATSTPASDRLEPLRAETLREAAAAAIARDDASRDDAMARKAAIAALGDRAGTVIVMDPSTGRVLTVVNQEWAVRRSFSSASTFKLVTSIAGLRTNTFDPSAKVAVEDSRTKLSLDEALAYSNTPYFADAGERAGIQALVENARLVGLGQATGIDLLGEVSGNLPDPQTADARAVGGYGKGVEVTPIQLAVFASAIGNGGLILEPRLFTSTRPFPIVRRDLAELRPALARLMPGMLGAVKYGTARPAFDPTFPIAGKTGTFDAEGYSVGWFASFEATSPRYTVVVLVAGKGVMGHDAARIAGRVYKEMGC
jgi:penicillin-binding protein 2